MTLTEALQYLETTARVSCPQITCDQAREIAEVLRGHQSIIDLAVMLEDGVKHGAGCCDEIGRGRRLTQIREHIEHVLSGRQAEQVKNQLDDAWSERDESRLLADREFTLRQRAEKERDEARARLLHSQICVSGLQAQREESAQSTQIRINLIKIAQEQHMQAHSAIDKLGPFAEGPLAQRIGEVGAAMDSMRVVIDTLRAQLREAERERQAEIDCGQPDVCAKPPGCQKHWAFKASELVRERDEAQDQIDVGLGLYETTVDNLVCEREDRESDCQIACGFAWDAGREMAVAENTAAFWEAQHAAQKRYHRMVAADKAEEVDRLQEQAESLRRQLDAPVEAAPDFDADDYAKPGKR